MAPPAGPAPAPTFAEELEAQLQRLRHALLSAHAAEASARAADGGALVGGAEGAQGERVASAASEEGALAEDHTTSLPVDVHLASCSSGDFDRDSVQRRSLPKLMGLAPEGPVTEHCEDDEGSGTSLGSRGFARCDLHRSSINHKSQSEASITSIVPTAPASAPVSSPSLEAPGIVPRAPSFEPMSMEEFVRVSEGKKALQDGVSDPGFMTAVEAEGGFRVKAEWVVALARSSIGSQKSTRPSTTSRTLTKLLETLEEDDEGAHSIDAAGLSGVAQRLVRQPSSPERLIWAFAGALLVVLDMICIPLLLIDPEDTELTTWVVWISRIFWQLDIGLMFTTGFHRSDGSLEMRLICVAERYVKTWFAFDAMLVALDWTELCLELAGGLTPTARLVKMTRAFRVLRMLRVVRLLEKTGLWAQIAEQNAIFTESLAMLFNIAKSTISLMFFAHVAACLWYKIGTMSTTHGSWVEYYGYLDKTLTEKYVVSVHWSMTQFIGTMDIQARNVNERVYAVVVLLTCFVLAAAFVSSITTSMARLDFLNNHQHAQLTTLRRYLWSRGVSAKLSLRITRNAAHAVKEKVNDIEESSVFLLDLLSEPLRIELHYEVRSKGLQTHPLFFLYCLHAPMAMRQMCHKCVTRISLSKGDVLFTCGGRPDKPQMYFNVRGNLRYTQESLVEEFPAGAWAGEAFLWTTSWTYKGFLKAMTHCSVLCIDAEKFLDVMQLSFNGDRNLHPARYALFFVEQLNAASECELSDLDMEFGLNADMEEAYAQVMETRARTRSIIRGRRGGIVRAGDLGRKSGHQRSVRRP